MTITLILPLPPSMNAFNGNHWAQKRKVKLQWEEEAVVAWANAGRPKLPSATVRPIFIFKDRRRRDTHNYLGGTPMKGIIDGLVGRLICDDNHQVLTWLEPEVRIGPREGLILEFKAKQETLATSASVPDGDT